MNKRTFVLGDVHGGFKALRQVIKRSGFDSTKDRLICLGDVTDGWSEIPECFDYLLEIEDLVYLWGNHDMWTFKGFYQPGFINSMEGLSWLAQGGKSTVEAYKRVENIKKQEHFIDFLTDKALNYYVDEQGNAYMHAGINLDYPLENQNDSGNYFWNRSLFEHMMSKMPIKIESDQAIKDVFVGHTPTLNYKDTTTPINYENIWFIDTGACFSGPLTLMDVETKQYWQSDPVCLLYPDESGRNALSINQAKND